LSHPKLLSYFSCYPWEFLLIFSHLTTIVLFPYRISSNTLISYNCCRIVLMSYVFLLILSHLINIFLFSYCPRDFLLILLHFTTIILLSYRVPCNVVASHNCCPIVFCPSEYLLMSHLTAQPQKSSPNPSTIRYSAPIHPSSTDCSVAKLNEVSIIQKYRELGRRSTPVGHLCVCFWDASLPVLCISKL